MSGEDATRGLIPFNTRYHLIDRDDLPEELASWNIEYRRADLESNDVFIYYWVLAEAFGKPKVFEAEALAEPNEDGVVPGIKTKWRYYLRSKSGSIIEVRTEDQLTLIQIGLLTDSEGKQPSEKDIECGKLFTDDLLDEVEANRKAILSNYRRFDNIHTGGIYILFNMYLQNYLSAEAITKYAHTFEQQLVDEGMKYDARDKEVQDDPDKMNYITRHMAMCGSFFRAAILHYFMALEGFANLIYHGLLRHEFRAEEFVYERRLGLELKLLLLPSVCYGFKVRKLAIADNIMDGFRELRNLRNRISHGSINDTIKSIPIIEDGFVYTLNLDKYVEGRLPQIGAKMRSEHVDLAKEVVDTIIKNIIEGLNKRCRKAVERWLLNEYHVQMTNDPEKEARLILDA